MDVLTDLLDAARLRSSLYSVAELHAPWGMRFEAAEGMVFHVVHEGQAWLHAGDLHHLWAGDLVVVRHGLPHAVTDHPETPADYEVNVNDPARAFRRIRYGDPEAPHAVVLCGHFRFAPGARWPLLPFFPDVLHLHAGRGEVDPTLHSVLHVLGREANGQRPGHPIIVQRLADTLFAQVLRAWLERGDGPGGPLGALGDPALRLATEAMHRAPERPWTVAELARVAGLSRTVFATRFSARVGLPPLAYLTRWRMLTAGRLLREGRSPVGRVAERVGYESESTFSHAFKRHFGVSPGAYRRGL